MRFRVPSFASAFCIVLGCVLSLTQAAIGQIHMGGDRTPKAESTVHPEDLIQTTLALNLCVDGSTQYPCPPNVLTDTVYIPSISLTYGQILDGVVDYSSSGGTITSGTITIYKASAPANARIAVCTLVIGVDHSCPSNSTIFDVGDYTLSGTLTFPPGSGFANFDTSVGPCLSTPTCDVTVSVLKDTSSIALTSSANPAALGTAVTFTAAVKGGYPATPTGQVVFSVDGATVPGVTLDANGAGTYTTSTLSLGTHTIGADYAGALDFLPAENASITQQIVPPATITMIASSLNPSNVGDNVTFTASVAASAPGVTPAGAVTFKDGTVPFATILVTPKGGQNLAQTTISTLAGGTHSITAAYSGDAATSASVSPVLVQQVDFPLNMPPPGYTITITPSSVTLAAGLIANLKVTVTPVSGFSGAVMLSCSNLPKESSCTFGETAIPVGGGITTLAISTTFPHPCGSNVPYGGFSSALRQSGFGLRGTVRYGGTALAGVLLLLLPRRLRRRTRGLLALIMLSAAVSLSGCGNTCTDFGTEPGHYTIKVNGTAPSATPITSGSTPAADSTATPNVSTSLALTVQP